MTDYHLTQGRTDPAVQVVPGADEVDAWSEDQPVPYTLTRAAEAVLNTANARPQRRPARAWVLTPKAEAVLGAEAEPEPEP